MAESKSKKKQKVVRYTKAAIKAKVRKNPAGEVNYKGKKVRYLVSESLTKKGVSNLIPNVHVVRGDNVVVISGDDKGKIGKVLKVFVKTGKILVEGVNVIKKHQKAMGPGRPGEIIELEAPIASSNVMLWDENSKKASRVGHQVLKNGKKVRVCKVSGEQID